MALKFPFIQVSPLDEFVGEIPNYQQVIDQCPTGFKEHCPAEPFSSWRETAICIFGRGISQGQMKALKFVSHDPNEILEQFVYLRLWISSFKPPQEIKMAVCAWLLSLMLSEVPNLK